MQSEESNTLVKLAKAVIEHAPEGGDAFWDIKFSDIEAALSATEPVAWRIVGKLDAGSITWKVVEHEHQAREEAKSWEKMCSVEVQPLYAAPPAPSVAVKALASDIKKLEVSYHVGECMGLADWAAFEAGITKGLEAAAEKVSALSAQVQDVAGMPQDVIDLVIAAREFWDVHNDMEPESNALDKALEKFASRVPFEDANLIIPVAPAKQEGGHD